MRQNGWTADVPDGALNLLSVVYTVNTVSIMLENKSLLCVASMVVSITEKELIWCK